MKTHTIGAYVKVFIVKVPTQNPRKLQNWESPGQVVLDGT